jgi:hypothetical protein
VLVYTKMPDVAWMVTGARMLDELDFTVVLAVL